MRRLFWIFSAALLIASCKSDVSDSPGAVYNKMDGIKASWTLYRCIQIDEKSLTKEYADITSFFTKGNKMPNIQFSDSTYSVDTAGLSLNYFGSATGKWKFDDVNYPTKITFTPNGLPAFDMYLNGPTRTSDVYLKFKRTIPCSSSGSNIFTYNLDFIRK